MATAPKSLASYSQLASEYYDAERHPTCANFREASLEILRPWFSSMLRAEGTILETGAGASVAAELRDQVSLPLILIVSDQSPEMLSKSTTRVSDGLAILDAELLAIRNRSVDTVVASLADPYNTKTFWSECARVLRPSGRVFFTTPAFDWASSFRTETGTSPTVAEFNVAEGGTLLVPSYVWPPAQQVALIRSAGLEVEQIRHVDASEIRHTKRSPKLRPCALVTGYRAVLRPESESHLAARP